MGIGEAQATGTGSDKDSLKSLTNLNMLQEFPINCYLRDSWAYFWNITICLLSLLFWIQTDTLLYVEPSYNYSIVDAAYFYFGSWQSSLLGIILNTRHCHGICCNWSIYILSHDKCLIQVKFECVVKYAEVSYYIPFWSLYFWGCVVSSS